MASEFMTAAQILPECRVPPWADQSAKGGSNRHALSIAHAALLVLLATAGTAAQDTPGDPLSLDERLQVKVTVAQKDRPLGEILPALGREAGVPLRASRETADDRATLFLDDRPAAEVMALIARQFDFQWSRTRSGYELDQTAAGRQREAALREEERQAQLAAIHARMERAASMAAPPPGEREQRESENGRLLETEGLPPEQRAQLSRERLALHPGRLPALAIYHALTPRQVRALLDGREVWLSRADGTMPPPLAEAIRQAQIDAARVPRWSFFFQFLGKAWPPDETEVVVRLFDMIHTQAGPPARGEPRLRLQFLVPLRSEETLHRWALVGWAADGSLPEPALAPPGDRRSSEVDDAALKREVDLHFPRRVPHPAVAGTVPPRDEIAEAGDGEWPSGRVTLGEVAGRIHRETGLEIVADSFIQARIDPAAIGSRRPLEQLLDQIAKDLEYTWSKEGSLLLFRNRRWYRDRAEEVPERILNPWYRRVSRARAASLDDLAALAAALTDSQARGLQQYWGWYLDETIVPPLSGDGAGFYGSRHDLRFWAGLTPAERRAVLRGTPLPVSAMTPRQRAAWLRALLSPSCQEEVLSGFRLEPAAEAVNAGGFRIVREEVADPDSYRFAYYLAGDPNPAREVELPTSLPRKARADGSR